MLLATLQRIGLAALIIIAGTVLARCADAFAESTGFGLVGTRQAAEARWAPTRCFPLDRLTSHCRQPGPFAMPWTRSSRAWNKRAFCLIRPPGHHATRDRGMVFCQFNSAELAAKQGIARHGLDRVLIVDWDVHHGNGTQKIFWEDGQVGLLSIHRHPFYPGRQEPSAKLAPERAWQRK
jgi:hypothetical protein